MYNSELFHPMKALKHKSGLKRVSFIMNKTEKMTEPQRSFSKI